MYRSIDVYASFPVELESIVLLLASILLGVIVTAELDFLPKALLIACFLVVWLCHMAPWPTPLTHSIGFLCMIRNGRLRLDFSLAVFIHNNVTNWQEFSYITLPTLLCCKHFWWFGSATWPLDPPQSPTVLVSCVWSGMVAFDLTFLWQFSFTITWQTDKNFHTLPCQHYYVANIFFCNIFFFPIFFSSQIAYHSPSIGHMKMPLGMGGPLGQ